LRMTTEHSGDRTGGAVGKHGWLYTLGDDDVF
jgi:hypothetical protein